MVDQLFNEFINPEPFLKEQQERFDELSKYFSDELVHYENYGVYSDLVNTGVFSINTLTLNNDNINDHFFAIYNILADGIEREDVHHMMISVTFADGETLRLSIFDYLLNLLMWKLPLQVNDPITTEFLFYDDCITQYSIKKYIDDKFIDKHRTEYDNYQMNNMIDEMIYKFMYIDDFSFYLLNTINEKDTIDLMKKNKVVWDALHFSTDNIPLESVKDEAMKMTNKLINAIKDPNGDHCLRDSFRSGEGVNPKQFREFAVNIGTKPDGKGGIYSINIDSNYMQEGVGTPEYYIIDSDTARYAQILNKENVGQSGAFSRKLRLNNMHVKIHPDPNYVCNTKTFLPIYIKDVKMLCRFKKRYFRFNPKGVEYRISSHPERDNLNLIGKLLYFRSPETCASHARGEGICYRCYGDLAYTNNDINPGCIASELLSSVLTQRLLSAKHLLETNIKSFNWVPEFKDYFALDGNMIKMIDDIPLKKWRIAIESEEISQESEYDDFDYNYYINSFDVIDPDGNAYNIRSDDLDNLYISPELLKIMRNKKTIDEKYYFDFSEVNDIHLFMVNIVNNGLSATLERCKSMLDKQSIIKEYKSEIGAYTEAFISTIIDGGLDTDAVHCEVLISNQIRRVSDDDNLSMLPPEWEYPDEKYKLITLDKSLKENPSVVISLNYQGISKLLYTPLTFVKNQPSIMDLFFMEKPQDYMNIDLDYDPSFKDDIPSIEDILYHDDDIKKK